MIHYAQLELCSSVNGSAALNVRDLAPAAGTLDIGKVSWNNQPISATANSADSLPLLDSQPTPSGSAIYRFAITPALQNWYAGGRK